MRKKKKKRNLSKTSVREKMNGKIISLSGFSRSKCSWISALEKDLQIPLFVSSRSSSSPSSSSLSSSSGDHHHLSALYFKLLNKIKNHEWQRERETVDM